MFLEYASLRGSPLARMDERLDEEEGMFGAGGGRDGEEEIVTPALVRIAVIAGLGSLLFGYDTGVVSGALLSVHSDLGGRPLSLGQESFLVTSALFGALGGSIAASRLADWKGRKPVIVGAAVLFALGALEQAAAQVFKEVILGRVLVGIAVGLASMVLPVYLAEISPPAYRGRLVASTIVLVTGGQLVAYIVGAVFAGVEHGWRWIFGLGTVPAIAQLLLSFTMPESPRFDLRRGRVAKARKTLRLLYSKASGAHVQRNIEVMQAEVGDEEQERAVGGKEASKLEQLASLWKDRASRRALVVACGLQMFQQLTGFNALMYFSAKIIQQTHLSQPAAFALFIAVSNFLSTFGALRLVDRLGRRTLLLRTLVGMTISMSVLAFSFAMLPKQIESQGESVVTAVPGRASLWAFLAIAAMVMFCCSFALGLGNVAWVVQSEVFNQDLRALGNGIATAVNWTSNLVVSSTFLYVSKALTPAGAFGLYSVISALGWVFTWHYVPETKNLSLDEVRAVFEREVGMEDLDKPNGVTAGGRGGYQQVREEEEEEASEEESPERHVSKNGSHS
ncbi:hypothetical protein JCM8547_006802 [Rhodosporidiobolus lusitaniae]